jgi:hypothetical protein
MNKVHLACLFGALFCLSGCNRVPYELAPVHGTVMIENKPFAQGSVVFSPIAKGEEARVGKVGYGRLQPDGRYRLSCYGKDDGAVVGDHWVTIINLDEDNMPEGIPEFASIRVPEQKTVVAGKDNEINISLTKAEVRKYREDDR